MLDLLPWDREAVLYGFGIGLGLPVLVFCMLLVYRQRPLSRTVGKWKSCKGSTADLLFVYLHRCGDADARRRGKFSQPSFDLIRRWADRAVVGTLWCCGCGALFLVAIFEH